VQHGTSQALPVSGVTVRRDGPPSRVAEFLLVGGATLLLFPLAWLLRRAVGLDDAEYAAGFLTFYGAYVVNDPHFAVTYLLFYKDARRRFFGPDVARAQRARYWVAGVVVPGALAAWATLSLARHSAAGLGWMIQLMFLLVGWHYVKQGFGVLTVLAARRGTRFTPRERAVILLHCFAGWAFAWSNPASAAGEFEEKGVVYFAPAHPRWLELFTGAVLAVSSVLLIAALVAKWRREGRALPWAPLSGFLITVWAWTIFSSVDPVVRYLIPALHSIQYLYFVWLMKGNEARASEGPPTFGRPVAVRLGFLGASALGLGWVLFRGAPSFLDAVFVDRPARGASLDALGETPYFAAFFVVVNVHHYFMDHVVWRRENPDTRFLQQGTRAAEAAPVADTLEDRAT
jgi:hypothetical protein